MKGYEITVKGDDGKFIFSNKVDKKIVLSGSGKVELNLEDLKKIFQKFDGHFQNLAR